MGRSNRQKLLWLIHQAQNDLRFDSELAADIKYSVTGKESAADMSEGEMVRVIQHFITHNGWQPKDKAALSWKSLIVYEQVPLVPRAQYKKPKAPSGVGKPRQVTVKQWLYIRDLQRKLRMNDSNLREFIKHVCKVDHEKFLDVGLAKNLITGMLKILGYENGVSEKYHKKSRKAVC